MRICRRCQANLLYHHYRRLAQHANKSIPGAQTKCSRWSVPHKSLYSQTKMLQVFISSKKNRVPKAMTVFRYKISNSILTVMNLKKTIWWIWRWTLRSKCSRGKTWIVLPVPIKWVSKKVPILLWNWYRPNFRRCRSRHRTHILQKACTSRPISYGTRCLCRIRQTLSQLSASLNSLFSIKQRNLDRN